MKVSPECYDCLARLAAQGARLATEDAQLRKLAEERALDVVRERFRPGAMSTAISAGIHAVISGVTRNPEPYKAMKQVELDEARILSEFNGPFDFVTCLNFAALGNALDFFKPIEGVRKEMAQGKVELPAGTAALLESRVKAAKFVLYLADNAGEVFFDLPLLGLMRKYTRVVYVVKASPIQNDVTMEDISRAEVEKEVGEVMTTGTATAGVHLAAASKEFLAAFETADFVFAKGMGYYETLEELPASGRILFCLKAKCQPVAESLKVPLNTYVARMH